MTTTNLRIAQRSIKAGVIASGKKVVVRAGENGIGRQTGLMDGKRVFWLELLF
jgi:hypothetical protein